MPPLDLEPIPDPAYPDGWPIGSSEAAGTDYEAQELLHKPHAFALMHGDNGAKIAYGQLHWRVDSFTLKFMTDLIEVTVADHDSHHHDHVHTHTFGTHTHEYPHTHEYDHTHVLPTHVHTTGAHDHTLSSVNDGGYGASAHTHTTDAQSSSNTGASPSSTTTDVPDEPDTTSQSTTTTAAAAGAVSGPANPVATGDDISNGTTNSNRVHTVGLPTITYCSQSAQETMANMSTTTPKVKTKDGIAMDPQWGNTKYHELDEYGTVYLVWQVDIESGGNEVQDCWVQVGEPEDTTTVGNISEGTSATNRRNADEPHDGTGKPEGGVDNDDKGIFYIEIGTVAEGDHVEQKVSSDVNWTSTVMDREAVTAVNATPTGTFH